MLAIHFFYRARRDIVIRSFGLDKEENVDFSFFLSQIMKDIRLGIVIMDQEGRIQGISRMACEWLGVKREEVGNLTIEEAFPGFGYEHFLNRSILDGVTVQDQAVSWRNGEVRYDFVVDSFVLTGLNGEILYGCYTFKNVSNLRGLEQKIERSDRLAMIGQIAAGTAHEIRNPLTSINGFLQMMGKTLDEKGMSKEKQFTDIMLREIKRINELVSEFLLLSRQKEIQYRLVDIEEVFNGIIPIVESEALLHGIEVRIHRGDDSFFLVGDSELLKQVLLNISKNGIEAMGKGGVLTIELFRAEEGIEIRISDTGPGISPYLLDKIFDPFFTTKEEGTGLGLPVCHKIIHEMGGNIRVSSKGYGATFYLTFPN